jgi:hypothetical protein
MDDIVDALHLLRPGAQWSLFGDTYEGLNWVDTTQTKPSLEEIEQAIIQIQQSKRKIQCSAKYHIGYRTTVYGSNCW